MVEQLVFDGQWKDFLESLSEVEQREFLHSWEMWARPKQLPPDSEWRIWLMMTGRGFGKTRAAAEWIRNRVESEKSYRIHLVAPTPADGRDTMIEGESGILEISHPNFKPVYEPSKRRLTWPNGAVAIIFSGANPDQLRGPQCDTFWAEEVATWDYPEEAWSNLMFGFRLGADPRGVATTTPRPISLLRRLIERDHVAVTRGSSYENRYNIPDVYYKEVIEPYEGTQTGRQEIYGHLLEEAEGSLWKRSWIDANRVSSPPELMVIVVGVDPAVTSKEESDETGIVVVGLDYDHHAYVLDDRSVRGTPEEWAQEAVRAYKDHNADMIIGEANARGTLVEMAIHGAGADVPYRSVWASRGKRTRAEPISQAYQRGYVSHVGEMTQLEDQMCNWVPGDPSPDRMDALVWGLSHLLLRDQQERVVIYDERRRVSRF